MSVPFSLTILGSGGALPVSGKFPSSQFLQIGSSGFLIDAGEGVQIQLMKLGISNHRIHHVFISHLHGDHYLGLMGLLFSMHLSARKQELNIHSHTGLDEIILTQLRYAGSVLGFPVHFKHLKAGVSEEIIQQEDLIVSTIPLKHRVPCSGFLFKEKQGPFRIIKEKIPKEMLIQQILKLKAGEDVRDENGKILFPLNEFTLPPHRQRSYAYCSDTAPDDHVVQHINGVDLLYHEATFSSADSIRAAETFHSTAEQAATIAAKAKVGELLIGHFSARYKNSSILLDEAREIFEKTRIANEGNIFEINI